MYNIYLSVTLNICKCEKPGQGSQGAVILAGGFFIYLMTLFPVFLLHKLMFSICVNYQACNLCDAMPETGKATFSNLTSASAMAKIDFEHI